MNTLSRTGNKQIYKQCCAKHRRRVNTGTEFSVIKTIGVSPDGLHAAASPAFGVLPRGIPRREIAYSGPVRRVSGTRDGRSQRKAYCGCTARGKLWPAGSWVVAALSGIMRTGLKLGGNARRAEPFTRGD
jgi:hypothetical protein